MTLNYFFFLFADVQNDSSWHGKQVFFSLMFTSLDAMSDPVISRHADQQKILHTRKRLSSFHRGKGLILNISSGIASVPFPMYTLYSASKVP